MCNIKTVKFLLAASAISLSTFTWADSVTPEKHRAFQKVLAKQASIFNFNSADEFVEFHRKFHKFESGKSPVSNFNEDREIKHFLALIDTNVQLSYEESEQFKEAKRNWENRLAEYLEIPDNNISIYYQYKNFVYPFKEPYE